jgi:hypothetical protein
MIVRILMDVVGFLIIGMVLFDVFQSVIVPRAVGRRFRFTYVLWRGCWTFWPALSWRLYGANEEGREDFLAVFAPLMLVLQLVMWSILLVAGFGLVFLASAAHIYPPLRGFGDAFYFAGTSFFTIGFGDYVGRTGWTRALALAAGASGFGVVSTVTAFLFAIFGSFQQREQFVTLTSSRAGTPPNGVAFLVIAAHAGIESSLPAVMQNAQAWTSLVMETHLAYPALAFFRSSHDYQSWVGTLGTLLDAATLMMTTVRCEPGEARITYEIGRHATIDLVNYFRLATPKKDAGLVRQEFDHACDRLERAGWELHDRDEAWKRFSTLRSAYAPHLNTLARFFAIPPLQWIGDRSPIEGHPALHSSTH